VEPALFGMIERACVSSKTCCMKNNFARTKHLQHKVQHHVAMILSVEVQDYFWKKLRTQHIKFLPTILLDWRLGGKKQTWFATSVCGQVKIYHAFFSLTSLPTQIHSCFFVRGWCKISQGGRRVADEALQIKSWAPTTPTLDLKSGNARR
jgi:hypothetical protein